MILEKINRKTQFPKTVLQVAHATATVAQYGVSIKKHSTSK
jgi:hypothetical protein